MVIALLIGGSALWNVGSRLWRGSDTTNGSTDTTNGDDTNGTNATGSETQNSLFGIGVSVLFQDGSRESVKPKDATFQILPLTIFYNGKAVSSITWSFDYMVEWEGDLTDFTLKGWISAVTWTESSTHDLWWPRVNVATYIKPVKGVWESLWSRTLSASEIETKAQTVGEFTIITDGYAKVDAAFASGFSDSKEASVVSEIVVNSEQGLTLLSIQVTPKFGV